MNETKKMKFPVAAIFTALLALGLIENLRSLLLRAGMLDQMIGYRMYAQTKWTSVGCAGNAGSITRLYTCKLFAQQWLPGLF